MRRLGKAGRAAAFRRRGGAGVALIDEGHLHRNPRRVLHGGEARYLGPILGACVELKSYRNNCRFCGRHCEDTREGFECADGSEK